jgi:hypothetical protein
LRSNSRGSRRRKKGSKCRLYWPFKLQVLLILKIKESLPNKSKRILFSKREAVALAQKIKTREPRHSSLILLKKKIFHLKLRLNKKSIRRRISKKLRKKKKKMIRNH